MTESPAWLEPLDPGWRWVAYVPLAKPQSQLEGVVYMYPAGVAADGYPSGMPSYSVAYSLRFSDGKLAEGSDLWMDSFGNGAFAPPIPRHLLPYREWLDYRPLPVITGENSKDPKLLGVDEYVQKGTDQTAAGSAGGRGRRNALRGAARRTSSAGIRNVGQEARRKHRRQTTTRRQTSSATLVRGSLPANLALFRLHQLPAGRGDVRTQRIPRRDAADRPL